MCAKPYKTGDPYKLNGNRLIFTNWQFINQGSFSWYDAENRDITVKGDQGPNDAFFKSKDHPKGIRLSVVPAIKSGPVFHPEKEWEKGGVAINTIVKDGNTYKAWGHTSWGSSLPEKGYSYVSYYESIDGYKWNRPKLGIIDFQGSKENNLTNGPEFPGLVFIDPTSGKERFKMTCEGHFTLEQYKQYLKNRPDMENVEANAINKRPISGIQGAVSEDGLHWNVVSQPLAVTVADTQVVCYYDTLLKKYVIFSRDWNSDSQCESFEVDINSRRWQAGRRSINRAESNNFREFPIPELIIEPGPDMLPNESLYTNCYTSVPGAPNLHLMFPTVWVSSGGDFTHIIMYSSHDSKVWNKMPGGTILKTGTFGEWDGGCVFTIPNLIELLNGDFALPYVGWNVPHKYPRVNATRDTGYALWPKGRIVALKTEGYGEFTTVAIIPPENKLLINAVTERSGYIMVEACDINGKPIPGREFDRSIPMFGDLYKAPVKWKNTDNLSIGKEEGVVLRFKMEKASIYSLEFSE